MFLEISWILANIHAAAFKEEPKLSSSFVFQVIGVFKSFI